MDTLDGNEGFIGAVVMAAGLSLRMGGPKMVLPWGDTTVIGQVVRVLFASGVREITVVTGGFREAVEAALQGLPARTAFNPRYMEYNMALSLQTGLQALPREVEAALVALGDQPQIEATVVQAVINTYRERRADLVVPSFQMRRGHPWLVRRTLWPAIFALQPGRTLRDFLHDHSSQICYLPVESPSVLKDLDTPVDYQREKPGHERADEK